MMRFLVFALLLVIGARSGAEPLKPLHVSAGNIVDLGIVFR